MTLHLSLHVPGMSNRVSTAQNQEIREARRLVRERIRDDWEYPTLPQWKSCGRRKDEEGRGEEKVAGFRFHARTVGGNQGSTGGAEGVAAADTEAGKDAWGLGFDPVGWRERQYSSASDTEVESASATKSALPAKQDRAYKFDDPDSVGLQLQARRVAKKRKRALALQDEMEWNDGLSHWIKRRDAWCCARVVPDVPEAVNKDLPASEQQQEQQQQHPRPDSTSPPASASASTATSPRSSTSSAAGTPTTPTSSLCTCPQPPAAAPAITTALVPVAPPLLPDHPVRRKITTHIYPEIYSKIIVQSRTPSVPINLATLLDALVQGWKDDGEWPPKAAPAAEKSLGRKKGGPGAAGSGLKESVRAVGRVLRLTGIGGEGAGKN